MSSPAVSSGYLVSEIVGDGLVGFSEGEEDQKVIVLSLGYLDLENGNGPTILHLGMTEQLAEKLIADLGEKIFGSDAIEETAGMLDAIVAATNKFLNEEENK